MNKLSMLALGVSVALGLAACSPASKTETQATQTVAETIALTSGIDLTAVDSTVSAQNDLWCIQRTV